MRRRFRGISGALPVPPIRVDDPPPPGTVMTRVAVEIAAEGLSGMFVGPGVLIASDADETAALVPSRILVGAESLSDVVLTAALVPSGTRVGAVTANEALDVAADGLRGMRAGPGVVSASVADETAAEALSGIRVAAVSASDADEAAVEAERTTVVAAFSASDADDWAALAESSTRVGAVSANDALDTPPDEPSGTITVVLFTSERRYRSVTPEPGLFAYERRKRFADAIRRRQAHGQ